MSGTALLRPEYAAAHAAEYAAEYAAAPVGLLAAVARVAEAFPHRPALAGAGEPLTYAELWSLVRERSAALTAEPSEAPGVVTVEARHAPSTVVELLAAWAAGGTYLPLDPAFPAERVESMLAAVEVGSPEPSPSVVPGEAAYVLFTSGSTGRPKPVAVPHAALDAVVPALVDLFGLRADDRVLQFASLNWDTCFEEILPTLAAGATLVFDADAHAGSLSRFLGMVERRGITVLDLPTAFWHELVLHLDESRAESGPGAQLPECVRLVVTGGEAISPRRLAQWQSLDTGRVRLLNTYGATETALITHAVSLHGPGTPPWDPATGVPLGRPLPHVVERITADGELLVGGAGLALGYPGLPEETAERFVEYDDRRWFRTGDRVERPADGLLRHRGRLDGQVKVRGIRVDPGEVEANLTRHPALAAAAVVGITVADRTVLAAYVVPSGSHPDLVTALRDFLRADVAAHLHPARITVVAALELTPSGKVDRRATHARFRSPPTTPSTPTAPESSESPEETHS